MSNYTEEIARSTKDPNVLIEILRRGHSDMVSWNAASNPNCPPEMLVEVLKRGNNDSVSRYAANNPNCPSEMLVEVLKKGKDDSVSRYAANNPNCPSGALVEVLKRGIDNGVSDCAAENPNCPILELHQWLIITNNLNNSNLSDLLPKIQQYISEQEEQQNKLLKQIKSQYNNPILSLEL
jgi:hypothetical protein